MVRLPLETDVFVVGGGPAGLAAALAARSAGLAVVVADRRQPPVDKACGEGLMPDGVAALAGLGVGLDRAPGLPFFGIRFVDDDLRAEARFYRGSGLGIRRPDLHQVLIERACDAGVILHWRTPVDGLHAAGVRAGNASVRCRWIVGADGIQSRLRGWAGLHPAWSSGQRIGLRQRFRVRPWTDFVEVHWGARCQAYVTPVAPDEVCVTVVGGVADARLSDLAASFPSLARRLAGAEAVSPVRGGMTRSAKLRAVVRGRIALIGDAAGSVDAVTGEGLSLAFRQAAALSLALKAGDLTGYEAWHRRLTRRPLLMARVLLTMGHHQTLRRLSLHGLAAAPRLFESFLAAHVTGPSPEALVADRASSAA
jgi:flavin-dependent dehydrogenase